MKATEFVKEIGPYIAPVAFIAPAIIMAITAPELVLWYLCFMFIFKPSFQTTIKVTPAQ